MGVQLFHFGVEFLEVSGSWMFGSSLVSGTWDHWAVGVNSLLVPGIDSSLGAKHEDFKFSDQGQWLKGFVFQSFRRIFKQPSLLTVL